MTLRDLVLGYPEKKVPAMFIAGRSAMDPHDPPPLDRDGCVGAQVPKRMCLCNKDFAFANT